MKAIKIAWITIVGINIGFISLVMAEDLSRIVEQMIESERHSVKAPLKVVDEQGQPISGAKVISIFTRYSLNPWKEVPREDCTEYLTDSNGLATISGKSDGDWGVRVEKKGYYSIGWSIEPLDADWPLPIISGWHPSDMPAEELPITKATNTVGVIVLKKMLNPISLYAKRLVRPGRQIINAFIAGNAISYDLAAGDYLPPYGQGKVADLIYNLQYASKGPDPASKGGKPELIKKYEFYDAVFTLTFSNEGDGIQSYFANPSTGGELLLPYCAPENNYTNILVIHQGVDAQGRHGDLPRNDQNYFFRVRTKKDKDGKIVNALYGKIYGAINWFRVPVYNATYYLNPTPNDRNLEFDPKKNLFQKLESVEQINAP